jgi:S-adenosyl-L-methionine hydrolase (adenosine-forming)
VARRPITFLSDYGSDDEFAGVCRAVMARIAPAVPVIDLGHGVRRHDVAYGAGMLTAALPYTPPGVHLAVVDPGVGGDRRAVAIRLAEDDRVLVGPDNGLFAPVAALFGGAKEAVEISSSPVRLQPVSATFHGRDLFAPVAAHAALGRRLAELGDQLDPATLIALELPGAVVEPGRLNTVVTRVDGFGNAALAAVPADADHAGLRIGAPLAVTAAGAEHDAEFVVTFADSGEGALVVYVNAVGKLGLAVNCGNAAQQLGLEPDDEVVLRPYRDRS